MKHCFFVAFTFILLTFSNRAFCMVADTTWCNHAMRPGLEDLHEIKTSHPCFKVYDVGQDT